MQNFVVISDRGGHWQNAQMLIEQMGIKPSTIVTTVGPEVVGLRETYSRVIVVPTLFTFIGKTRFFNPLKAITNLLISAYWSIRIRPKAVVSLGATNVVFFCYFAKFLGAKLFHVECMNQVVNPSITGRALYPVCDKLFVQWPELLSHYGAKASYEGWVI